MATSNVSGFVDPSTTDTGGFNFSSFLNSVGGSLNQWAVQTIDRQVNKDTTDRGVISPPEEKQSAVSTTFKKYMYPALILIVGYLLYKQFKKG